MLRGKQPNQAVNLGGRKMPNRRVGMISSRRRIANLRGRVVRGKVARATRVQALRARPPHVRAPRAQAQAHPRDTMASQRELRQDSISPRHGMASWREQAIRVNPIQAMRVQALRARPPHVQAPHVQQISAPQAHVRVEGRHLEAAFKKPSQSPRKRQGFR